MLAVEPPQTPTPGVAEPGLAGLERVRWPAGGPVAMVRL